MSQFILSAFGDEIDPDLHRQIHYLRRHDIRHIEIRGVGNRRFVDHSVKEAKEIKEILDAEGFRISAIGSPIGKIPIKDDFLPHLELFKHTVELAHVLKSNFIRVFSFYIPEGEDPDVYHEQVAERWLRFLTEVKDSEIVLLHENEKAIYGDTPERCLALMKEINSPQVRAIFDPANFVQGDVETYPHAFNLLADYVVYLHIKDALKKDRTVVPPGRGDGKIKDILQTLRRNKFEGFLSLEPHLGRFAGSNGLEPGSPFHDLPEGGPKQFAIAAAALKKILDDLE